MEQNQGLGNYNFMTTISIPVYDKRENAVSIFQNLEHSKATIVLHSLVIIDKIGTIDATKPNCSRKFRVLYSFIRRTTTR